MEINRVRHFASCLVMFAAGSTLLTIASAAGDRPIRQVVSELRRFQGAADREMDVPPRVRANLTALKHALRDVIVEVAASPDALTVATEVLNARVVERLEREGVPVGDEGGFGAIPKIEFRRPSEYPAWLIGTTSLSIPYGLDTSLYLFEIRGSSWKHVLTLESNGYTTISDAQGWLTYYVAPPAQGQKPYLVAADITPSSASVWQMLRVKVLRIGSTPATPLVLASRRLDYCLDDAYYFSMRANGFGLIYLTSAVDGELAGYRGVHYLEYAVDTNRASRVEEVTIDPYNVIGKWAAEDWLIALRSVDASAREGLRDWHQRFRTDPWACGLGGVGVSHRVDGTREQLLAVAGCTQGGDKAPSAYVVFAAGRRGFQITSISNTKPELPEETGEIIYSAGGPGMTDPALQNSIRPKLPAGVTASGPAPVKVPFRIIVKEDGSVDPAVTVRSWPLSDDRIIVPAISAVRQWKYKPGVVDGHPVKVSINVDVVFE
jgi:hypothetical protein